MKLDLEQAWSVRFDIKAMWQGTRPYQKHMTVLVFSPTLSRAVDVVRHDYPDANIWSVNHAHKDAVVLVERMPAVAEKEG